MTEELSQGDFRTTRCRLPLEAFLWAEGPDLPPSDLVEKQIWSSIISFPDDVSIRTSDHHGTELKAMHELWGGWIESFGEKQDAMWYVMLDTADELQACLFNSLCGFYRVAASCLRTALELTTIGTYFQLSLELSDLLKWKEGRYQVKFGMACDHLIAHRCTQPLGEYIKSKMNYSIFGQRSPGKPGGWARKLHSELSDFVHSLPTHSSGSMWEGSNGPIYVPPSFGKVYALYLDTVALAYALVKLARPSFKLPGVAKHLFHIKQVRPSKVAVYTYEFLFGKDTIHRLLSL
ncbi:MAG: hypothetical protein ACE5II_02785 [Anaerolineae bacterium]